MVDDFISIESGWMFIRISLQLLTIAIYGRCLPELIFGILELNIPVFYR
jgi:hypothetical protein